MITADLVCLRLKGQQFLYTPFARKEADAWIARNADGPLWEHVPAKSCLCCGVYWDISGEKPHFRCKKHVGRNPCAIEGCKCTTADGGFPSSDDYLCSKHYRPLTTPSERKTLAKIGRKHRAMKKLVPGKKSARDIHGEIKRTGELWWKVFHRMVKHARRRSAGDIDMAEIKKMFGWE